MMKLILAVTVLLTQGVADPTAPRLRAAHLQPQVELGALSPDVPLSAPANATATVAAVAVSDDADSQDDDLDDSAEDDVMQVPAAANATMNTTATKAAVDHSDSAAAPASQILNFDDIEQSLAKLSSESKGKATPGMIKFVKMVKGMIKNDMKPKIMDAHRKDQQLLNSYKRGFFKCGKGRRTARATMSTLVKTKGIRSSVHKRCRRREATYYKVRTRCEKDLAARKGTMNAACKALKDITQNPYKAADNCHAARTEKYSNWLDRNERWFIAKNKEYKKQLQLCLTARKRYYAKRPICRRRARVHVGVKASCDVKQDQLETSACNLGKRASQTCNGYKNCFFSNKKAYRKSKPGIKKQERDRKGEWRVLMRVKCLLDVFAKEDGEVDTKQIDKCKKKTHDTTHLDLAFPKMPKMEKCAPMPAYPGQNAFRQAEYSQLPKTAEAKIPSICVVTAGGGVELGAPKGVPAAQCSMARGGYLKAGSQGSCLLSNPRGKALKVDYTKNTFTTYSFLMKFEGNAGNYNRMPVGGFSPCNVDRKSYRRGQSPEFNFYDIRGNWGYTYRLGRHHYSRYQHRRWWGNMKAYPKRQKALRWEITVRYAGNRRLYIYSWKVNGVQLPSYRNYITNCWSSNPRKAHAFTPRVWAWGATKGVYIKDFKVFQGLHPMDMIQIVGTGIPRTPYTVSCGEKGKRYAGRGIPGYGRTRTRNVLNCQKRCSFLAGCAKFTYYPDGWCYYFSPGARRYNTRKNVISGPPTCQSPYRTGLKAEFFFFNHQLRRMPNLVNRKPQKSRTDLVVWYAQTGGHWPGIARHNFFAAKWTGSILIKQGGSYRFDITSDDGSFLWIDGRVVVSNPGLHGPRTIYRWSRLKPGYHDIMLNMFENGGGANMYLRYYGPDTDYHHVVVPTEVLRPKDKDTKKNSRGPFGTPDDRKYYKFPQQTKLLRRGPVTYALVTVRAKNDAHVGLFPQYIRNPVNQRGQFYEFVFGGWGDQRSAIRRSRKSRTLSFPWTKNIVSKYEYRNFWVSVNSKTGVVAAGRGHNIRKYQFMSWKDPKPMRVKALAVMTGWGGTGEWVLNKRRMDKVNQKKRAYSRAEWFLGEQGKTCSDTCAAEDRKCDENLRDGFSYNKLRMYIKENLGVTCEKDKRRWWSSNQPNFVSGGRDSNQNKCLAFSNIPTKVKCSGKHRNVMRWCKCSKTKWAPHIVRFRNRHYTWSQMKAFAKRRGGRLMTKAEARQLLKNRYRFGPMYRNLDVWSAIQEEDGKRDWVQLGSRPHRPGIVHTRYWGYPRWGDTLRKRGGWWTNTLVYMKERR